MCPQCLVHSPVGVRCPDCAQVRRLPTFDVTGVTLARAIAAGAGLAIAGAVLFFFARPLLGGIPFATFILSLGIGFIIGEGISISVNRRRGKTLKYVAAGSVVSAFILIMLPAFIFGGFSIGILLQLLLPAVVATYVAINRF
ncbi:MAG: hypothetical protein O7E57_12605 [Gammaproteobacteria bacterium]|nr:hypothetical protein [Gammaproteobacteria bacterium]